MIINFEIRSLFTEFKPYRVKAINFVLNFNDSHHQKLLHSACLLWPTFTLWMCSCHTSFDFFLSLQFMCCGCSSDIINIRINFIINNVKSWHHVIKYHALGKTFRWIWVNLRRYWSFKAVDIDLFELKPGSILTFVMKRGNILTFSTKAKLKFPSFPF